MFIFNKKYFTFHRKRRMIDRIDRRFKKELTTILIMKLEFIIAPLADYVGNSHQAMEDIIQLAQSIFPCRDARASLSRKKLKPKYVAFVVDTNNRRIPVGFIIWRLTDANHALLYRIGVKENYRRHGIGTALFMFSTRYLPCQRAGCLILLHCNVNNIPARQFYNKLGFGVKQEIKNYYNNGDSAIEFMYQT